MARHALMERVVLFACMAIAAAAAAAGASTAGNDMFSHHPSSLNSLIHDGFSLAAKRGHSLQKDGGKIVIRYVQLDEEHNFLAAVPLGMKTHAFPVHEHIADTGMWSPTETQVLIEILSRTCGQFGMPQLLLDVGCNVGWFCSIAAAYGCKCMAFDGSLESTTYVKITSQLNGWGKRMHVQAALVSNETGVTFDGWNVQRSSTSSASSSSDAFTAASVRLDDVVKDPVVFMKVDVEGWEPSVFDSAAQLIAQHPPPYIFFEITYYLDKQYRPQYIKTLHSLYIHGYKCAQIDDPKAIPSLLNEDDAKAWFETLCTSPTCDTTKTTFCQEDIFCVHKAATFTPSTIANIL